MGEGIITQYWQAPAPPSPQRGRRPHPSCKVLYSYLAPPPLLPYPADPSAGVSDPPGAAALPPPERLSGHSPGHCGRRTAPRRGASPLCPLPPVRPELGGSRCSQAGWLGGSLARPLPAASRNPWGSGLHRDRGEAGKRPDRPAEVEGLGGAAVEGAPSLLPALGAALGDFPSPGKNVCVFGMERRGRACATKVAGSWIFRSQSPLSPAVIVEFSAAEWASGWHAKPGPDRGAGLRSTLTPPDLPLLHSSHPPPRLGSVCARGGRDPPAKQHQRALLPFAVPEGFYTL